MIIFTRDTRSGCTVGPCARAGAGRRTARHGRRRPPGVARVPCRVVRLAPRVLRTSLGGGAEARFLSGFFFLAYDCVCELAHVPYVYTARALCGDRCAHLLSSNNIPAALCALPRAQDVTQGSPSRAAPLNVTSRLETGSVSAQDRAVQEVPRLKVPAWSEPVASTALQAASSSSRGGGWVPGRPVSPWGVISRPELPWSTGRRAVRRHKARARALPRWVTPTGPRCSMASVFSSSTPLLSACVMPTSLSVIVPRLSAGGRAAVVSTRRQPRVRASRLPRGFARAGLGKQSQTKAGCSGRAPPGLPP